MSNKRHNPLAVIRPGMTRSESIAFISLGAVAVILLIAVCVLVPYCVSAVRESNRLADENTKFREHLTSASELNKRMLKLGKHLDAVGFLDTMGAMSEATPDDHECVRKFRDALRQSVSAAEAARSNQP